MPPSIRHTAPPGPEPVEFSFEDALLNTWIDEGALYLRLDGKEPPDREPEPADAA